MKHTYFERLDSLRFYAVFCVIFAHIFQIWTWQESTVFLFPVGNTGVVIFFVLSGFLITNILLSQPKDMSLSTSFRYFYLRRALRIFPIYYLYLLIAFSFNLENIEQTQFYPWLYLTNIYIFSNDTWLNANSHLWSLSIEEQFYIFWPFLVLLLKEQTRTLFYVFAGIILLTMSARVYLFVNGYSISPQIEVFTLTNLDSLTLGGVLALVALHYNHLLKRYAIPMIVGGLGVYYLSYYLKTSYGWEAWYWSIGKFAIAAFAAGLVLYGLVTKPKHNILHNPVTIYLGKISYGLYLYHNIIVAHYDKIARFFGLDVGNNIIVKVVLSISFTVAIAQLSFMLIEKPLLRLKRRYQ